MAKKPTPADAPADAGAAGNGLATTVHSLAQVAQSLADSTTHLADALRLMHQMMPGMGQAPAGVAAGPAVQINAWEDDPFSEETPTDDPPLATPIQVPLPVNNQPQLQFHITGTGPAPGLYDPGTENFRYWEATEALTRGINFWGPLAPQGTVWTTTQTPMTVTLVAGEDLNANYSRDFGLRFYQEAVQGRQIFSGESPDVSCHELGHAVLDAVRPELFDAASTEVAAFHESFGDMSAILSALQLPSLCQKVLVETGGHLNVNSRLSRLAEQLGWAIRQLSPTAVDPDCLRNAANRFFYVDPDTLPPSAPASQLCSEVHSFSRVFTGAFLDALARMLPVAGPATVPNLQAVSRDLGRLLVEGVRLAPVTAGYYSQVAAAMLQVDQAQFRGQYQEALRSGFVEHGILAPAAAAALASAAPRAGVAAAMPPYAADSEGYRRTASDAPQLPVLSLTTAFGLPLDVHAPAQAPRFQAAAAALGSRPAAPRSAEDEARSFVEDLIQLGRIDFGQPGGVAAAVATPPARSASKKTHRLVPTAGGRLLLKRLHFNCGCRRAGR
jgi:hypothetical protein